MTTPSFAKATNELRYLRINGWDTLMGKAVETLILQQKWIVSDGDEVNDEWRNVPTVG